MLGRVPGERRGRGASKRGFGLEGGHNSRPPRPMYASKEKFPRTRDFTGRRVILLGPVHKGEDKEVFVDKRGTWRAPAERRERRRYVASSRTRAARRPDGPPQRPAAPAHSSPEASSCA